jgi:hypothetical protein
LSSASIEVHNEHPSQQAEQRTDVTSGRGPHPAHIKPSPMQLKAGNPAELWMHDARFTYLENFIASKINSNACPYLCRLQPDDSYLPWKRRTFSVQSPGECSLSEACNAEQGHRADSESDCWHL